ncbi:hypothetical protein DFH09DRAFT_1446337 [Mycena vulgaris]|nr:hypothetical protein DFH09DRAFT_1446337 [Mycena vulgaris]
MNFKPKFTSRKWLCKFLMHGGHHPGFSDMKHWAVLVTALLKPPPGPRRTMCSPLKIPELLDHTVSFLDDEEDFHACSLVNRSWVHSAQSWIFSEIDITNVDTNSRLLAVFEDSPHLVGFVSMLRIHELEFLELGDFVKLSNLPYIWPPRHHATLVSKASLAIQRFLRIPSLVSVDLFCHFETAEDFYGIWEGCSRNIRHLTQGCYISPGNPPASLGQTPAPTSHPRIKLDSLDIMGANSRSGIESWFEDPRCPFDVSRLKALYFNGREDTLRGLMHAARETIEVAFVTPLLHLVSVSALRRITDIKIPLDAFDPSFNSNVAQSFSLVRTIGEENRWRLEAIQLLTLLKPFTYCFALPALMEFDRQLCSFQDEFPNLKVVEIVIEPTALVEGLEQHFPRLKTRIPLRWNTAADFDGGSLPPWYAKIVRNNLQDHVGLNVPYDT